MRNKIYNLGLFLFTLIQIVLAGIMILPGFVFGCFAIGFRAGVQIAGSDIEWR